MGAVRQVQASLFMNEYVTVVMLMVCRCEQVPKRKEGALAKPATPVATSKPSGEGAVPCHTSAARLYLNLSASYAFVY